MLINAQVDILPRADIQSKKLPETIHISSPSSSHSEKDSHDSKIIEKIIAVKANSRSFFSMTLESCESFSEWELEGDDILIVSGSFLDWISARESISTWALINMSTLFFRREYGLFLMCLDWNRTLIGISSLRMWDSIAVVGVGKLSSISLDATNFLVFKYAQSA